MKITTAPKTMESRFVSTSFYKEPVNEEKEGGSTKSVFDLFHFVQRMRGILQEVAV